MAKKSRDEDLEKARGRVRSFEDKANGLQRSGGNLDRSGQIKSAPSGSGSGGRGQGMQRERDSTAQMKQNSEGKSFSWSPQDGMTNDDYITGKSAKATPKVRQVKDPSIDVGFNKKQEAILRETTLNLPAVRSKRISNADGATSFHFSHEAISKTRHEKTTAKGTKNRKGAAKDHARYIERDGAVSEVDADDLDKIEKELLEIAENNPELAGRLNIGKYDEDRKDARDVANALGIGALAGVYIEREEALAHTANGTAVLFSNISEDPKERRDFWQQVEQREKNPSEDQMRILIRGNEDFWQNVANDEECPKKLKKALQAADPTKELVVKTQDNEEIRNLMKRYGWKPRERRPADETDEQRIAREERERDTAFGAYFEDGRGGRVQFRIVGELPYDVDHLARIRILKGFAEEFEKRNLPYIAVMHAPDHTNDDRNWHFHLVYHDRPARRFTGKAEDHMWDLPDHAGTKIQRQHEILKSTIGDKELEKYAGQWDFTVPWNYRKPNRHTMTTYPFEQEKSREVNNRAFIPGLRKRLADLTNRELEVAQIPRRLDPRTYSQMGIHKNPDVHLGTQASQLESLGIATEAGLKNEQNQWNFIRENLENRRQKEEREIDRKVNEWEKSIEVYPLTSAEKAKVESDIVRWGQEQRKAVEHHAIALNLQEHFDRMESRANKLANTARKHIKAINEQRASRRQSDNLERYKDKLAEAESHLAGLKIFMAEEIMQIAISQGHAKRHGEEAAKLEKGITQILGEGKQRMKALEAEGLKTAKAGPSPVSPQAEEAVSNRKDQISAKTAGDEGDIALSKADIDGFLKRVTAGRARVVIENGLLVPKVRSKRDDEIIASSGYELTQNRLRKVKESHDRMIADLAAQITRNPRMLVAARVDETKAVGAPSDRYRIASKDKVIQQAWVMFSGEPEILAAVAVAEKVISSGRAVSVGERDERIPGSSQKREASQPQTQRPSPEQRASQTSGTRQAELEERIIEATRTKFLRPTILRNGDKLNVTFSKRDSALHRLPEQVIISDVRSVARMEGVMAKNNRSVKRIVAYLEKNPDKIVISTMSQITSARQGEVEVLKPNSPSELRDIARNHALDPEVMRAVENAIVRRRLDMMDPRNEREQESIRPASPAERTPVARVEPEDVNPARTVSIKPDQPANDKAKPVETERSTPARPIQEDMFAIKPDPSNGTEKNPEEGGKPAERENRINSSTQTPIKTDDGIGITPTRDADKKDEQAKPVEPRKDLPVSPSVLPIPDEEKKDREKEAKGKKPARLDIPAVPELQLGPKKIAGTDPYAVPESTPTAGDNKDDRKRTVLPDAMAEQARQKSFEKKEEVELRRGINPKLDRWIEADAMRDREERARAANAIRNDRRLMAEVNKMHPQIRARLQQDWETVDDEARRIRRQREEQEQKDKAPKRGKPE